MQLYTTHQKIFHTKKQKNGCKTVFLGVPGAIRTRALPLRSNRKSLN